MPSVDLVADTCVLLRNLSDRNRLSIIRSLADGPKHVGAITEMLDVPQPTASHHLGLLRAHRVVTQKRDGKQVLYSVAPDVKVDKHWITFAGGDVCIGRN